MGLSPEALRCKLLRRDRLPQIPHEAAQIATEVACRSFQTCQNVRLLGSQQRDALVWINVVRDKLLASRLSCFRIQCLQLILAFLPKNIVEELSI